MSGLFFPKEASAKSNLTKLGEYFNVLHLFDYMRDHLVNAFLALVMILLFRKISNGLKFICTRLFKNVLSNTPALASFIVSVMSLVIDVSLVLLILKLIGIELTGLLGVIGAFSLIIGFGFKDIISNFFAGIVLLSFSPIKAKDVIVYNDFEGVVKKIEIFYTTLIDFENTEIIIPNAKLMSTEILNVKDQAHRRLILQVGVGFNSDIDLVKQTIQKIIEKRSHDLFFIKGNPPVIGIFEIGSSALIFEVRVFVRDKKYMHARYYLNEEIKREFDRLKIVLPYNISHLEFDSKLNTIHIEQDEN